MHKYLISLVFIILTFSNVAFASLSSWDNLSESSFYQLDREIILKNEENQIVLKPGMRFKLKQRVSMGMIKVELYKFDIQQQCSNNDMTTDIELIDIVQPQNNNKIVTVGVDLAEDCILEIYVEYIDLYSLSLFQ